MRVIGVCGNSGAGKTTFLEGVIAGLRAAGQTVSVIKHAHHRFDIDHPGKDSWRHRQAGAGEVLVEGFKHGDLPKVEVWRAASDGPGRAPLYPQDPRVVAVATDAPEQLPASPTVPVLDLNDPAALVQHLLASGERYLYHPPHHG